TFFGGLTYESEIGKHWTTQLSLFGNATDFENPTVRNYEKRNERSFGLRTENHWTGDKSKLTFGAEFQTGRSLISVDGNDKGVMMDTTNNDVRLPTSIFFLFAQYDWTLPQGFFL